MNKAKERHLPGDQGGPVCLGCKQKLHFGTDHNGGAIQWCRCGEFPLATIRLAQQQRPERDYQPKYRGGKPDRRAHGDFE